MIGNELFKLEQELQFGEGKKPYPWEHNDALCPFKILENQEMQMSQELFEKNKQTNKKPFLTPGIKRKPLGKTESETEGLDALQRAIPILLFISTMRNDTPWLGL